MSKLVYDVLTFSVRMVWGWGVGVGLGGAEVLSNAKFDIPGVIVVLYLSRYIPKLNILKRMENTGYRFSVFPSFSFFGTGGKKNRSFVAFPQAFVYEEILNCSVACDFV